MWRPHPATPTRTPSQEPIPFQVVREVTYGANDPSRAALTWNYGVQFGPASDEALAQLRDLANHELTAYMGQTAARHKRLLATDLLWTHNADDGRIAIYHDHPQDDATGPFVVIVPDVGHAKEDYLSLSYCLVREGFQVLRYDPTDHPGESDVSSASPLMSHMQRDLYAILDFATEFWPDTRVCLLGEGIGGRLSVRAVHSGRSISAVALINPAVDLSPELHHLRHTTTDPLTFANRQSGMGILRRVRVQVTPFVHDAVMSRYVSGEDWLQDLADTTTPITIVMDTVESERQQEILDRMRTMLKAAYRRLIAVSTTHSHHFEEPARSNHWYKEVIRFLSREVDVKSSAHPKLSLLSSEITQERLIESQRLQYVHQWSRERRERHWEDYVQYSHSIVQSPSYQKMLSEIASSLGTLNSTQRILELGCGTGEFAFALLTHPARRALMPGTGGVHLPEYVGIDLCQDTLRAAHARILALQHTLSSGAQPKLFGGRVLSPWFILGALDTSLPFPNRQFDVVFANLLIGYMRDPLVALQECVRVLAPDGQLVVIVPNLSTDLLHWLRSSSTPWEATSPHDSEEGSLEAVLAEQHRGWIEGTLHRFSFEDLRKLLIRAGTQVVQIDSVFDQQFYRAVAKRNA